MRVDIQWNNRSTSIEVESYHMHDEYDLVKFLHTAVMSLGTKSPKEVSELFIAAGQDRLEDLYD